MITFRIYLIAMLCLLSCSCNSSEFEVLESKPAPSLPVCADTQGITIETIATHLEVPWDMDFAPDGRIFVTERRGRIRVIEEGKLREQPWAEIPVVNEGVVGLMGIAVAPDFKESGYIYAVGTVSRMGDSWLSRQYQRVKRHVGRLFSRDAGFVYFNRVYRLRDINGQGAEQEVIIDDLPADLWHGTSSLFFGPDKQLYVSTGDAADPAAAQDPGSLAGKLLRYTAEGKIPNDNPNPDSPIFASGFRQSQGFDWHPINKQLFASEHGEVGYDELNQIIKNGNYGWPHAAGASDSKAYLNPLTTWETGIAPSGLAIFHKAGHEWNGNVFIGGLKSKQLRRLVLNYNLEIPKPICEQALIVDAIGRIRSVRRGPDGYLYISTSNRDHRNVPQQDDDRLFRLFF